MCPTLAFIHHSKYSVDAETGLYVSLHEVEDGQNPDESLEWTLAEFIPRSIPCWSHFQPESFPEGKEFVMSKENLNRILQDEKFEVIENMCYASDQSEDEGDEEYLRQTKTFGEMMSS